MTPEQVTQILDELGQRLGPTGSHVFELAVRQVYLDAVGLGLFGIVLLAFGAWAWRRANDADWTDRPFVRVIGGVLLASGAYLVLWQGTTLLNPEYAAIRNILSAIGGAK